jgi:hypothetical protein
MEHPDLDTPLRLSRKKKVSVFPFKRGKQLLPAIKERTWMGG